MRRTFTFQFHITEDCNQRCKHCYIFKKENYTPLESTNLTDMAFILDNCLEMSSKYSLIPFFTITGGDPLLNPDIWSFLELLKKHNIKFAILGNPFLLNNKTCKVLKNLGCEAYQLSLDGLKKTHDFIRSEGSFEKTIEAINLLNQNDIETYVMSTISSYNIDDIPKLIDIIVENNVNAFHFTRYCATNENNKNDIKPLEYRNFLDNCYKQFIKYKNSNTEFKFKDHLWNLYLYEKGIYKLPENIVKRNYYDGCSCAISFLTIKPNGDVYACSRFESKVGNALKEKLSNIWHSDKMKSYRYFNSFKKCRNCELLNFCRGCPAVAFGNTNDFYEEDPQCWKKIKE